MQTLQWTCKYRYEVCVDDRLYHEIMSDYESGNLTLEKMLESQGHKLLSTETLDASTIDVYLSEDEPEKIRGSESVTGRISHTIQPRGGYIKTKSLEYIPMKDGIVLFPEENVNPASVGLTVDYLSRLSSGTPFDNAFAPSLIGVENLRLLWNLWTNEGYNHPEMTTILDDIDHIIDRMRAYRIEEGLSDDIIKDAIKMTSMDPFYRVGPFQAWKSYNHNLPCPTDETVSNIRTMVMRTMTFFDEYGPITKDGFTFENPMSDEFRLGGYSPMVGAGDGDLLTADTLWDLKVSKHLPTTKHTLQILMYWIMGKASALPEFDNIDRIGLFNPRLNEARVIKIRDVPLEVIREVVEKVIGYDPEIQADTIARVEKACKECGSYLRQYRFNVGSTYYSETGQLYTVVSRTDCTMVVRDYSTGATMRRKVALDVDDLGITVETIKMGPKNSMCANFKQFGGKKEATNE